MNNYILSEKIEYALGWMVVHSLWQATLIAILWGIGLVALRNKTAQLRYFLANISLLLILASAVLTFDIYYQKPTQVLEIKQVDNKFTTNYSAIKQAKTLAKATEPVPHVVSDFKQYLSQNLPLIVMLWLLGMVVFLLKLLGNVSYVYYLKRRINFPADEYWADMLDQLVKRTGLKQSIQLMESALVRTPMLIGHLKPVVLFPLGMINRMSPAEVEAILAHEIAHILRRDYLFNIFQSVVEAIFYYHPAVWWLSSQIRDERESACDEVAIDLINGNAMNYAKALVTVQEMAFLPMSASLAFAGQARKSQFITRIQRVLNINQNKTNAMEKTIAICLVAITVAAGLVFGQSKPNPIQKDNKQSTSLSISHIDTDDESNLGTSGYWNASIGKDDVDVQFSSRNKGSSWNTNERFLKTEFSSLPIQDADFKVIRASGTMNFKGKFEDTEGYGRFSFVPNTDFTNYLDKLNITGVSNSDLLFCFMSNMDKTFLDALGNAGYTNLSSGKLRDLAIHNVQTNDLKTYVALLKKDKSQAPDIQNIIELKIHGVDEAFMKSITDAGYTNLSARQLVEAKIHGLDADFIKELNKNTKEKIDLQKAIEMKIQGVNIQDINEIKNLGYKDLELENDLGAFAIHGVDAEFIKNMNSAGLGKLSSEDLLAAKIHNLNANYIKEIKGLGFSNLSFDNVMTAKIHGLTGSFIDDLRSSGLKNLSFDDAISAKIHGFSSSFIKELSDAGVKNLSFEDATAYKIHDITGSFIQGFSSFKGALVDDYLNLKIQGVTPAYVKGINDLGFKNLKIDDFISARIHGVSADFIKQMREKGYQMPNLDDYVNLKITGGTRSLKYLNSLEKGNMQKLKAEAELNEDLRRLGLDGKRIAEGQRMRMEGVKKRMEETKLRLEAQGLELEAKGQNLEKVGASLVEKFKESQKPSRTNPVPKFMSALVSDGLIVLNEECKFILSEQKLMVNGKKIKGEALKKYLDIALPEMNQLKEKTLKVRFLGKITKVDDDGVVHFKGMLTNYLKD